MINVCILRLSTHPLPLHTKHFPISLLFSFILSLLSLNLSIKSALATGNYNEQLNMTAPPAAKISHTHTHAHTPPPPQSLILSPSSQNNRLLPNSALIFSVNNTDISPPSAMKGGGKHRTEGREGKEKRSIAYETVKSLKKINCL